MVLGVVQAAVAQRGRTPFGGQALREARMVGLGDRGGVVAREDFVGAGLQQALVGREQRGGLAAALGGTGHDRVLHVLQCTVGGVLAVGIGIADVHQGDAVRGFGRCHARVDRINGVLVAARQRGGAEGDGECEEKGDGRSKPTGCVLGHGRWGVEGE